VNKFRTDEKITLESLKVDPAVEQAQRDRLARVRARRDPARTCELLTRLEAAARGTQNLIPLFVEAVENDVTLGEICGVLRSLWGEYRPPAF